MEMQDFSSSRRVLVPARKFIQARLSYLSPDIVELEKVHFIRRIYLEKLWSVLQQRNSKMPDARIEEMSKISNSLTKQVDKQEVDQERRRGRID